MKLSKIDNSKDTKKCKYSKRIRKNPLNEFKNNSKETKTNLNQQVTLIQKK